MAAYVPDSGEVVWLNFSPQAGHEQAGRRPAVVLSPRSYNQPTGLAILCPITNRAKGYPFEVTLPETAPVTGVVLADQIRNLDWRERRAKPIGRLDSETLAEIFARLLPLLHREDEPW